MQETITKCDACGQIIAGPWKRVRIVDQVHYFVLHTWLKMDICRECWTGLKAVGDAIKLASKARGE